MEKDDKEKVSFKLIDELSRIKNNITDMISLTRILDTFFNNSKRNDPNNNYVLGTDLMDYGVLNEIINNKLRETEQCLNNLLNDNLISKK